jgi:hypothetical protein
VSAPTLLERARTTAERWRARGADTDRVNRYCGRVEVLITRLAARAGALPPTLYVSSDGRTLTTWPGNVVAPLEIRGTARGFNGVKLYCYRAVIEGRAYHGRGLGPCMYLNLRPGKVVAK